MAVAAAAVAALFVVLLLALGYSAYKAKTPLITPELLILPFAAIVLSFAARRIIKNSEGTRTGELFGVDLPAAAWWVALVAGLGYGAYWWAIDYSIRRDVESEVKRWTDSVLKGELTRAFDRTLPPPSRFGSREAEMKARHREELSGFYQSDLVRTVERNKGACEFVPGGLRDWSLKQGIIDSVYSGTLRCPEGLFPVHIPLKGAEPTGGPEAAAGRQWQIQFSAAGYFARDKATLTPYGWFVIDLLQQAGGFGRAFVQASGSGRGNQLAAYLAFTASESDPVLRSLTAEGVAARMAVVGGLGYMLNPPPAYLAHTAEKLFTRPDGAPPTADEKARFTTSWSLTGLVPSGSRVRVGSDQVDLITVTDSGIEVKVPADLPLPGDVAVARTRVVVVCTDPEAIARARELRASANPDASTPTPPADFGKKSYPWRVVRVESDLYPIRMPTERPGAGGPDG
jgi:hypothetical protein